jgi:tetratricopeptide (TPR) repeat protein
MTRIWLPLLLGLLFTGCSQIIPYNPDPQAKAFDEEDLYIFSALVAEEQKRYGEAAEVYSELYQRSNKNEYLYRALAMYNGLGDFDRVLEYSRKEQKKHPEDKNLIRFEVIAMLALKQYDAAKEKALKLVAEGKAVEDLLLVSEIYIKTRRYDTALKYLERAYAINFDENILDKMSIILYVNLGRKSEAISYLESHSRLHGCSALICKRLAGYYSEENNVDGMLSTYLRLYEVEPLNEYAQAIIKIYSYKKEYPQLLDFLEKSGADDITLLQLYINAKSFAKAARLSLKLYEERGDAIFLGQHAIFTYESAEEKSDRAMLDGVIENLEKVIKIHPESLYLNYLGYLLIDHDLDVRKGMEYVRQALEQEPESPFYNDSLAWGHYKLGECEKAKALMGPVIEKLGTDDAEVAGHLEAIEKCLKTKHKTVK